MAQTYAGLVPDINRYAPPEVSKTGWDAIKRNPVAAVDSYDFGLLIYEVFNGGDLCTDHGVQTKNIPPTMQQPYKRLLNANPKARLSVSHFLEQGRRHGGFFETALIRLSEGVESLGLKDDAERAELLRCVPIRTQGFFTWLNSTIANLMRSPKTSQKTSSR